MYVLGKNFSPRHNYWSQRLVWQTRWKNNIKENEYESLKLDFWEVKILVQGFKDVQDTCPLENSTNKKCLLNLPSMLDIFQCLSNMIEELLIIV